MSASDGRRHGIPALKPAPIVASYLGYPGTVGAEFNDYTIADKVNAPREPGGSAWDDGHTSAEERE